MFLKISHHHKPYMINHVVTRGKEVSSQMTISAVIFGMKSFILSWRSAYVHKVYKILFCCIQNHSSHLFWWEKVCFTLKSVNNILFEKKMFVLIHVGKIYFLCIKTSFKQMLTHVLIFCYVTKKKPKLIQMHLDSVFKLFYVNKWILLNLILTTIFYLPFK